MDQPAADAGKNWLPDFAFTIADTRAAPPGPGFTMSRDDARSMLNLAKQAREQFNEMRQIANSLTRLAPPADEFASNSYNSNLVGDGQSTGAFGAGLANVERMHRYADELVRKLEKALGITESSDEAAAKDVKTAGTRPEGLAG
ncbi:MULTISPECIES: hypothetical protein [Amycolatopsis]|uniref:Uncharacterized protein n=1 Tax=Amycolatopsis dendrobii TaxID=2760662 RepID=A0A7W3W2S1_9PSEU|nr:MULTISPECIES: hypothetical protein [Amycolatopsis]MBB1157690.1 hypothetical protein [Amycolatopsis dendrobii]UKD54125.1 hypothetical protein L3Q65_40645 [Amycolatopsis sp. FU40]